jgi:hypothetical protein
MFFYDKGIELSFKELAEKHYQGLESKLRRRIKPHLGETGAIGNFYRDLAEHDWRFLKSIISGDLYELARVIMRIKTNVSRGRYPQLFSSRANGNRYLTSFGRSLTKVFNYDAFRDRDKKWDAYQLTEQLGIDVCPYCNRGYTFTINKGQRIARPELDHFLAKSKYPYLALSFYNLIPSCHICNANLKHDKTFDLSNHIHPYRDSLHEIVKFSIKLKKKTDSTLKDAAKSFGVGFFYGSLESFDIITRNRKTDGEGAAKSNKRATRSLKEFRILETYERHKDLVMDMILSATLYEEDYIQSLLADFEGKLFRNRDDVLRYITHNYPSSADMPKRAFSKLARDIHQEFGLIY